MHLHLDFLDFWPTKQIIKHNTQYIATVNLTVKLIFIDQLVISWDMGGDYENCIQILHKFDHLGKIDNSSQ